MKASYLANTLLSFEGDSECVIHQWDHNNGSQYYGLNFACTQSKKNFIIFTKNLDMTQYLDKVKTIPDQWLDGNSVIDYKNIFQKILSVKELLPLLIGLDKNLDKIIAERMKE